IRYFFNLVYFSIAQPQLARTHHAIRLTRVPRANNRSGHGGVAQRPRDCDFSRRTPMPIPDLAQFFNQLKSSRKARLLEIRMAAAPIVFRPLCRTLGGHWGGAD